MITDNKFNSFDFYLKGIIDEKMRLKTIKKRKIELNNLIQNINWDKLMVVEININGGNTMTYEISFGNPISDKIDEIKAIYESMDHLSKVGEDILFGGDALSMNCTIQIGAFDNRIHIAADGIPKSIRGLGLGCKIYRAVLNHVDYITSINDKLFGYGKLIWNSLRNSELFYTFYHKTKAFCFASDKCPVFIIGVLEKEIDPNYINKLLWDEGFVKQNRSLIEKSKLKKLL